MRLAEDEREVLLAEVGQAAEQVRDPQRRAEYGELLSAVDSGEVPDALLEPLQVLLEVALESGRVRRVHTAHGETAALRVYARTPKGRAVRDSTARVNEALRGLTGRPIEEVALTPAGPGAYSLTLATDQGRVLVRIDRLGVRMHSLEVG